MEKCESGNKIIMLCNCCAKAFKKGQYCYHCFQIYMNSGINSTIDDYKSWIQCDTCKKWVCLIEISNYFL